MNFLFFNIENSFKMISYPYKIILGSGSPRRKQLLEAAGFQFEVVNLNVDEELEDHIVPEMAAHYLARKKSKAYSLLSPNEVLITADTVVIIDNEMLAKPADPGEAVTMLEKLSGKSHLVITGVCIRVNSNTKCFSETSVVHFRSLKRWEIDFYIENFLPLDKAGAYGIQEWIGLIGVEHLEGISM